VSRWHLIHGDARDRLAELPDQHVHALVTDPPAGIAFMGKSWDRSRGGRDAWIAWLAAILAEARRVLKPGAWALIWALPRTSHWTATAIENAGFDVRDVITHVFGRGFPKSDACLKPASEHWILARAGGASTDLQIDTCRLLGPDVPEGRTYKAGGTRTVNTHAQDEWTKNQPGGAGKPQPAGRWPANLVLSHAPGCELVGTKRIKGTSGVGRYRTNSTVYGNTAQPKDKERIGFADADGREEIDTWECAPGCPVAALEDEARFFYCTKVSATERGDSDHPTMKSIKLMSYLCKLITPPGGLVLDPFTGSGSTGLAALAAGFDFIGFEQDAHNFKIAEDRLRECMPLLTRQDPKLVIE
jgi:site-specific DNA-methyltransferase (adenine-specific)